MGRMGDRRAREIGEYAEKESDEAAEHRFGIGHETLRRYKRRYRQMREKSQDVRIEEPVSRVLRKLAEQFSEKELEALLKSGSLNPYEKDVVPIDFTGKRHKWIATGDTHWGSKYSPEKYWDALLKVAEEEDVEGIFHVGDVVEGMSNRQGHIYELTELGYTKQKAFAIKQLKKTSLPIYCIDGNHDRWFKKSNGAIIVKEIAETLDHVTFLGHDSATVDIDGCKIMLWHGEDGSSYATSYRPQKLVEAMDADQLPAHPLGRAHPQKRSI
jgi:predicted phosphodiesterase